MTIRDLKVGDEGMVLAKVKRVVTKRTRQRRALVEVDVFDGSAETLTALVVVASTLVYAACAVGLAALIFGAEAVLYGEQGFWSRRRHKTHG